MTRNATSMVAAAYSYREVEELFLPVLRDCRFEPVTPCQYDFRLLLRDPHRANYRGRFVTTMSLLARKLAI